jgi:hypothetical protein
LEVVANNGGDTTNEAKTNYSKMIIERQAQPSNSESSSNKKKKT